MTATATKEKKGKKSPKSAVPATPATPAKPILGVDLKGELLDIAIDRIIDPKGQADRLPRPGDAEAIEQLSRSMAECGQLQPVMLERLSDGRFCRVFGRRRLAAARLLGWSTIRASVVPPLPDDVRRTIVAIENVQRQDLTPAEETLAVDELMELQAIPAARQMGQPMGPECGAWAGKTASQATSFDGLPPSTSEQARKALSHDALLDHRVRRIASEMVAAMLGKSPQWVRDRLYIGRLGDAAKKLVLQGKLPLAHAREISKLADEKQRNELAKDYAAGGSDSVSDVEAGPLEELQFEVRRSVFSLDVVPWQRHVAFAGRQPCEGCQFNSATQPGLFEGGGEVSVNMIGGRGTYDADKASDVAVGICTKPDCYQVKLRAAKGAISAAAKRIVDGEKKPSEAKVPEFVERRALEKKVRDRRASAKVRAKRPISEGTASKKPTVSEKEAQERHLAISKYNDAIREWARKKVEPEMVKKVLATPGLFTILKMITATKLYQATEHWQNSKATKAAEAPGLQRLLKFLEKPDWKGIVEIEKECGRRFGLIEPHSDGVSGMAERFAKAMGIDVDDPPVLEDFLPKPKGAVTPKASPATKPKKSRRAPASKSDSDVEDDE
ncbi:MAG: ParB N-terminal domain-containing protein [Phycisphaerales bacterium]|nr:MAG: ParB N-terminal domain-containing protein [Phycisphaerales bacterium]